MYNEEVGEDERSPWRRDFEDKLEDERYFEERVGDSPSQKMDLWKFNCG